MKKLIIGMILGALLVVTYQGVKTEWDRIKSQHAAESKCVAGLIAQEVERIDISTANGKCWEEENGYYN
ncbi:hypothetical protein VPHD69_0251 [Vibrio phage D69]